MTAITFYSDDKTILQKFLDLALQFNVKTKMQPVDDEEDIDAAILQKMLFTEDDADFETVSTDEANLFLSKLRQGTL